MAITQIIATLPAVLNDSATFYEDIAERNNYLVTTVLPSINTWALQANTTQEEINAKAAQVAAQAVDGGYSQNYINSNFFSQDYINSNFFSQNYINDNFIGANNAQDITGVKTFTVSPIVPTPITSTQAVNKAYVDNKPSGFKNLIINGNKTVNQSGLTTTDNSYNYDNHYKVGNNWFMFIEGLDIESGSQYTLSWEGTATASYYIGTAGSSTINAQSFTAIANGETITPTITSSQFLWIKFASDSSGSTYNKVQLEKGTVVTPFENRLYGLELSLVQRCYEILRYSAYSHHYSGGVASISLYYATKRITPIITLGAGSEGLTVSEITVNGLRWFNAAGYCRMAVNTILNARP